MPDNFLYSSLTEDGYTNMVTAEDLNNIAVDLGYADYSHFPEDPPQSAVSALNQITQDLTSKGILQIGNCCKVSVADGVITVADGVCVFESGAKKRLTEPVTLTFIEGSVNYVYMLNNITENQIQIITSLNNPAESEYPIDYVMLAEISSGGTVTDRRYWSISKVGSGRNVVLTIERKFYFPSYKNPNLPTYEYDISQIGANFVIFGWEFNSRQPYVYKLEDGAEVQAEYRGDRYIRFKKEGSRFFLTPFYWDSNDYGNYDIRIQVV